MRRSAAGSKQLEAAGIVFHLSARVTAVGEGALVCEKDGQASRLPCDNVLVSVGRRPVTEGYGLETLSVALERGAIATDERLRTSVPGVWAAGDVNGRSMLAHTAYREAEVAVSDMLGRRDTMRYDAIPAVIYTKPEVACVGVTPLEAADAEVIDLPFQYSGRYVAEVERATGWRGCSSSARPAGSSERTCMEATPRRSSGARRPSSRGIQGR